MKASNVLDSLFAMNSQKEVSGVHQPGNQIIVGDLQCKFSKHTCVNTVQGMRSTTRMKNQLTRKLSAGTQKETKLNPTYTMKNNYSKRSSGIAGNGGFLTICMLVLLTGISGSWTRAYADAAFSISS